MKVPSEELASRLSRFREIMDRDNPGWELAAIFSKVNLFYFTGTMPEGMLLIPRQEGAVLWVRRNYERALAESLFPCIRPMGSFRDAAASSQSFPSTVFLETEVVPMALYQRLHKHFPFAAVRSADASLARVRAVKSPFELSLVEKAGEIHRRVLEERLPALLREGMSEVDLGAELFSVLLEEGHHGVARFGMFDTEILLGHIAFGTNSLYPTYFDGPGGNDGLSPAVPLMGSRERKLRKGDLVFLDIGCGFEGYHTDKTTTYMFGRPLPDEALRTQERCVALQRTIASLLKPGAIPSDIYKTIMDGLDGDFRENFMGYGKRRVRFLGHGVGLQVDEPPVLAEGFDEPVRSGMVFAIEPKRGIKDVGLVGVEDTFVVSEQGCRSVTGHSPGLIPVGFSR